MQFELPIGQRYARQSLVTPAAEVKLAAISDGHLSIFEAMQAVNEADLVPAYLHSALCAMSLPARRPPDEMAPIIRQDGRYTLAITPKPILRREGGEMRLTSLGVPFGSYPRVILIYIMSEAVRTGARQAYLGGSFPNGCVGSAIPMPRMAGAARRASSAASSTACSPANGRSAGMTAPATVRRSRSRRSSSPMAMPDCAGRTAHSFARSHWRTDFSLICANMPCRSTRQPFAS